MNCSAIIESVLTSFSAASSVYFLLPPGRILTSEVLISPIGLVRTESMLIRSNLREYQAIHWDCMASGAVLRLVRTARNRSAYRVIPFRAWRLCLSYSLPPVPCSRLLWRCAFHTVALWHRVCRHAW